MTDPKLKRIMRRIKKCLALSKSDNEHEAAMALRQAKKLMEEYGISMGRAEEPEVDVRDLSEGKIARCNMLDHELGLYITIADFFGCIMLMRNRWPVFAGEAPAPEIAEYAAVTLLRQLRRNRKEFVEDTKRLIPNPTRAQVRTMNQTFGTAWVYSASKKIEAFAQGVTEKNRGIYTRAVAGEEPIREHQMRGTGTIKGNPLAELALIAGQVEGRKAELNHGMHGSEPQPLLTGETG